MDGLTGRRLFIWAYRAVAVAMALVAFASAAVATFVGVGGPRSDDAVPAVLLSLGGAYCLFLNRAVGRNWRAYVEARRDGQRWGHFLEVLYPPLWGFSKR
ncbi:hypothetical protein N865_20695 [Intrasporangium oryzae NRRL B-24470]|uniref:Uncharacterized protein n=1 Tax=Intrasporangium oryzae NRRL B-24470 TaxID=1386089 RepID=W9G7H0_9MICO|nr:hypothetical protein N865_20695 [Intrasporangium oryzae NRRL B-24470]